MGGSHRKRNQTIEKMKINDHIAKGHDHKLVSLYYVLAEKVGAIDITYEFILEFLDDEELAQFNDYLLERINEPVIK